jgi:co-chaperonin GroES (HSP10)
MLKPTQDYILVRPIERKQSSVLHVISYEKHCRGEVISTGPGKRDKKGKLRPLAVNKGDVVAFGDGNFDFYPTYTEAGIDYRIISEADVCFIDVPTVDEELPDAA